jgi:hypothetical protein
MGKVTCEACKKKCKKEAVRLQDKFYHVTCFACKECKKPLAMDGFYTKDDAHYCAEDYRRLFATKCRICGELAEGNVVTVLGDTYHQQCFHCSKCGKKFEPGDKVTFSNRDHWCKSCAVAEDRAKSPPGGTTSPTGSVKPGSPLSVSPPKPPRANDALDNTCGLTPNSDRSGYASSNGMSPEIAKIANLTCSGNESELSAGISPNSTGTSRLKSTQPARFGTPDNRFYNMSYLERSGADYKRGPTLNPTPKDPVPKHFHRPENFSYTAIKRDFVAPTTAKRDHGDKQEMVNQSKKADGDSSKLAPIERDDWPGPPEPAAAFPELFREKVYKKPDTAAEDDCGDVTDSGGRISRARTPAEELQMNREINELSKMKDSGAAAVILRDLRKKRSESPTLDPRNASRTPSAAVEPPNKPRYETPYFASPSRDLDMLVRHRSCSTENNVSRSTPPSRNGLVAPKPGYGLKCYTPDILNSYHYDGYESETQQPRRPQSSAAYLRSSSPAGCKTPTEEFDPTTGLRHSTHLKSLTLPPGVASHKYFDSAILMNTGLMRPDDAPKVFAYEQLKQEASKLPGVDLHALEVNDSVY